MTNVKLLKAIMVMNGDSTFVNKLSELLEISKPTASQRLSNVSEFSQSEIAKIKNHYNLTSDEVNRIFIEGESNDES